MEKLKRKFLQLFLIVVVLFSCTAGIFAQRITVSGKVTDTDQNPVTGANIVVKGTMDGTITNATGDYSIQVLPEAILEFSFIGMVRQEIPVANRTSINVVMAYDAIGLEEVVAVGYGVVRKADLTSAISKVEGEMLHNQPVASTASLLIGKSTGVHVITNSGAPGSAVTVRIRGAASLSSGGNDPLYVVDGIPTENILGINPNDIESIEVLKDASSSAIYGSRAANGVILISSKKGKSGVTNYSIDSYYGFNRVYKRMDMMNAQEQFEYVQKGVANFNRINPSSPVAIRPGAIADYEAGYDTDWQEEVFRTAPVQNYSFSANGGTDRLVFSSNIGYYNQQGVIISNG